ncbi:spatacsin [Anoplophora glabripennis]|uniref:spatacsin n=1 Tax=Anoplophora glabripennis TaxID=217634 RepID=UPI000874B710|nr:spatacsin [Anoplophora glabripennis]
MASKTSVEEDFVFKPPPPPNLTKEHIVIWTGWHCKGDKEVSREAAAKGIDIKLVVLFLSLRKKLSLEEAESFFRKEVFLWVSELLDRKQIFRVSHVLKNIRLDPDKELLNVFFTTTKKDLREYIGNHLKKLNELTEDIQQLWYFLNLILDNNVLISKYKLLEDSIDCLNKQSIEWKQEIAAKLFLRTQNTTLLPYLKGDTLWKQLLIYNDIKLLKIWINVQYNEETSSYNTYESFLKIFNSFPITNDMINQVTVAEVSTNTSQVVVNELSKFGIFSYSDINNVLNVLRRIDVSDNIENIYHILNRKHSNISVDKFLQLLIEYCLEHKLHHVLNICVQNVDLSDLRAAVNSSHLNLIWNFKQLINNISEPKLCDNIFKVSSFLCDDLIYFFKENPMILLALMFFTKHIDFSNVLTEKSLVILDNELFTALSKLLEDFKVLWALYNKITLPKQCKLTYYDLLEKHLCIDVKKIYSFQFGQDSVPHFNKKELVQPYGYSKQIRYLLHIKELRPSIACKLFLLEQFSFCGNVNEENLKLAQKKIYKVAVRNFYCLDITASCIAFLEMIGVNAESLKVIIKSANILSAFGYLNEFLVDLFINIEDDPYAILNLLEKKIINTIDFEDISNPRSFIEALTFYDTVIRFAIHYNLKLPELFLKQCANHNMWLPFLILAQIRNYPIEQIKAILQSLKNPNLLEHINHSVVHDIQVDERNILMRERDSRTSFFSRIGVHKSVDSLAQSESIHSSVTSQTSGESNSSSVGSDSLEIDILNTKTTLAQTLIRCHNSTDPPRALLQACQLYRNPLLAILATSYEPDSMVTNWLTWLAVSTELYHPFTNFESMSSSSSLVAELLDNSMKHHYSAILLQSLSVFLPHNPLRHFTDFLNTCINLDFNTALLKSKLEIFKESLKKCRRYSMISKSDHEMTYLNNRSWIESTSLLLLSSAIEFNVTSLYEQIQFVQCLCAVGLEQYINCPNIESLLDILTYLCHSKCGIRIDVRLYLDPQGTQTALVNCINQLLNQELFDTATKIAQIGGVSLDMILIRQWQYKYKNNDHVDKNFWENCSKQFSASNICADRVVEFYLEYADNVENCFERYQLLKLAYEWARSFDLPTKYDIEKWKWMAYLYLDKSKRLDDTIFEAQSPHLTYKEMLEMITSVPGCDEEISSDLLNLLEEMMKQALTRGNFWQAFKLEKMFKCKCQDLSMLKLSHSLAEGIVLPYQLNAEQRLLFSANGHYRRLSHRRTFLSNRLSSMSSASLTPDNLSYLPTTDVVDGTPLQDTLTLLYILVEKVTYGVDIAYKIFMMYRISLNIEIPYHVIVSNTDYMKMLKDALEDDCMHKLDVVHDFIRGYQWSKDAITDFICEEIVNSALKYVKSKSDEFLMWNLKMDQEFHLILQLLQDNCSLLGNKIYSYASATHKVQVSANLDFKISELALVTELLITAHDCFTADCNMEGISLILKTCRGVISHLLMLRSWKLIVRLLTGVGRYIEMSYVFDILRENDQFEFLLRKGSRKDNALKVALLDYLKKYCPDNRDLYKIVALHFALFSEVALLWEREAQGIIRNLIAISKLEMQNNRLNPDTQPYVLFTNTDGTKLCLNKAIENYTHATEFHLQGEKLAKAMKTAKQAELIALQISLLKGLPSNSTAVCLLNVSQVQITSLISKELSFDQSLILVQAYNYSPDWAAVLYEQCVLSNNISYLHSFLKHLSLTDGLVHDISRKFLSANINTPNEINVMKDILRNLSSVHTKYRIASEMGFTDLVEDLITGGQLAYLKDTVWKKGYKR